MENTIEQSIEDQIAELSAEEHDSIEMGTLPVSESTDTDKGGNGKLTAAQRKAKADKLPKHYLPFGAAVFTMPDRHFEVQRTNRKGEKTGAVGTLMANLSIPMHGGIVVIKVSIWRDSITNRESGMIDDTFSLSLPRNQFAIQDGQQGLYDEWRQSLLDQYRKWRDVASNGRSVGKTNLTPRLVESRKPEPIKVQPTA